MERAGVDINKSWHIFLKVKDEPKREVTLSDVVDLEAPGIEKIRLMPRNIDNGEVLSTHRRDFSLLEADTRYLDRLQLKWDTIIDGKRRWLLIHQFPVPPGYIGSQILLALEIPGLYPGAAIYGFYSYPPLALVSGRPIPKTQLRGTILGLEFHGWSRHRGNTAPWDPLTDNVVTHLVLVEAALTREVEE